MHNAASKRKVSQLYLLELWSMTISFYLSDRNFVGVPRPAAPSTPATTQSGNVVIASQSTAQPSSVAPSGAQHVVFYQQAGRN